MKLLMKQPLRNTVMNIPEINEKTCEALQFKVLKYAVLILIEPKEFRPFQKKLNQYYKILEKIYNKCDRCNTYNVEKKSCPVQKSGMGKYITSLETYLHFTGLMKVMDGLETKHLK